MPVPPQSIPPTSTSGFVWARGRLSPRENEMMGALLDMYVMTLTMQFQLQSGSSTFTPEDHALAIRVTIEWARHRFPDLHVNHVTAPDASAATPPARRNTRSGGRPLRGGASTTGGGRRRTPR